MRRIRSLPSDVDSDKQPNYDDRMPLRQMAFARAATGIVLLAYVGCASAPAAPPLSPDQALAFLQSRLVGWAAYVDDQRVENLSVRLDGCVFTLTQRRTDTKYGTHLLHRDYPLKSLRDPEWFPGLLPGALELTADNGGAVIRSRWDNDPVGTYAQTEFLRDFPGDYGEEIARALVVLKRSCVSK